MNKCLHGILCLGIDEGPFIFTKVKAVRITFKHPVHHELVGAVDWLTARNLFTTVWRIGPTGEARRVLYGLKLGRSPAKHQLDGVSAIAVDPEGRIHIASRIMGGDTATVLQVLRVDEAGATVVRVTGASYAGGGFIDNEPKDGPAGRALFHALNGLCFVPDGTLYMLDEHLVRKLDRSGQVSTWAF